MQEKLPQDIVQSLGIDPEILGEIRINGLKTMIRNEVKKGDGFRDLNTYIQVGNCIYELKLKTNFVLDKEYTL